MRKPWSKANLYLVKTKAIYPGSFDPITLGHLSVIQRAAKLFSELEVVVVHNPNKASLFTISEREALIRESIPALPDNVTVTGVGSGLLVDFAKQTGAQAIIKGFRTASDIEYEIPMAQVNRDLSGMETLFLAAEPGLGYVSSSLVKEVAQLGGDVSGYLSENVRLALESRLSS